MPAKHLNRVNSKGVFSHVYNKGIENKAIFNDQQDYETFISYLKEYLSKPSQSDKKTTFVIKGKTYQGTPHLPKNYHEDIDLVFYELEPTHFHLVLYQATEGAVQKLLRSLLTRYSMYFNKRYNRRGSLFVGPYKSTVLNDEKTVLSFISYLRTEHKDCKHSAYDAYVYGKNAEWVNTNKVINFIAKSEDININEVTNRFKDLTNKEITDEQILRELVTLSFEDNKTQAEVLERRDLKVQTDKEKVETTKTHEIKRKKADKKPFSLYRWPEYAGLALFFFVLLGIGVRNISIQSFNAKVENDKNQEAITYLPNDYETINNENFDKVLSASDSALVSTPSAQLTEPFDPNDLLYSDIAIKKELTEVKIYKKPSIDSNIYDVTTGGSVFRGTPLDAGWYQVNLGNDIPGYIRSEDIEIYKGL